LKLLRARLFPAGTPFNSSQFAQPIKFHDNHCTTIQSFPHPLRSQDFPLPCSQIAAIAARCGPGKGRLGHIGDACRKFNSLGIHCKPRLRIPNRTFGRSSKAISGEYLAIDVGANVGDTLSIIRQAADVPVLCVEGDPQCVGLFKENAAQYDRVELFESFLSDKEGIETVQMDKEGWNTTLLPGSGEGGKTLQFRTLDSVTSGRSHPCGLLKLDVEGYEWKILSGSRMLLENDKPVICLEYNIRHSGFPPEDFVRGIENLRNLGYEHVMVYESQGVLLRTIALGAGWEDFLDMHHFLVSALSPVLYADIVLFPKSKTASFEGFLESERKYCRSRPRLNGSQALS